ncbi:nitrous oxide reductase family maturation protein NosD [Telmatospirillum sp.]|uniref:nitrous oxide reductase family maturation protein NosD n=1 Tax=Telmatospirillum sp. TaxID=2079197 RepID=UPI00284034AB|nr:nitrous oxide reductase family maturation protein NosD [Telmatospirillum sp.]MDR3439373.1 nitrous oxide reductase family maturation protein NosD [Telmatospirillum sp.]
MLKYLIRYRKGLTHIVQLSSLGALVVLIALSTNVAAAERIVAPGENSLARAVAVAKPGDVLILGPGLYNGPVVIDKPLTLEGRPTQGAVVDGHDKGTVIRIIAPDVTIRGLTVRNSGIRQEDIDSGIFADKGGDRALIENNHLDNNEFSISLRGAINAEARHNVVRGRQDLRVNDRGDGISVWNATGSKALDNDIRFGRDGIRSTSSHDNVFTGNRFHDLRYAIHYMWTDGGTITDNLSEGNVVGFALMYSRQLTIVGNVSRHDQAHGLLLNFVNNARIEGNGVYAGGTECVFIYNANDNAIVRNWFEGCPIGVHFTAGSERNRFSENSFVGNRTQVKYVGTRSLDWASNGRGNYWSDNAAFDLNGDGIADMPYRPNDIVDRIVWSVPLAKLLLNSPAVQVVRWAQAEFPAITPGGVIDTAPLMRPPPFPALANRTTDTEIPK